MTEHKEGWRERFDEQFPFPAQNMNQIDSDNNRLRDFIEEEIFSAKREVVEEIIREIDSNPEKCFDIERLVMNLRSKYL